MNTPLNNEDALLVGAAQQPALRSTLTLCLMPGVGPHTRRALLEAFDDAESVLSASADQLLQVPGVGRQICARILSARRDIDVDREIRICQQHGIDIVTEFHPSYPRLLREIPDPPGVLFCRGRGRPQDQLAIAIVGTRHATHYGLRQAERLSAGLCAYWLDDCQRPGSRD